MGISRNQRFGESVWIIVKGFYLRYDKFGQQGKGYL
jgi:hypothetical protein